MSVKFPITLLVTSAIVSGVFGADTPQSGSAPAGQQSKPPAASSQSGDYVLGANDQITIWALELEEISQKALRIDASGFITLPLAGRVKAAGMTVADLERDIVQRLKKYQRNPQVTVSVTEFRSQPVSIFGAVNTPGVHHLEGKKTLIETLALAGGLKADAGYSVKITRRREWGKLPLPNAITDPSGEFSVAEVSVREITEAKNPEQNILIMPQDVISVPRAQMIYVMGEVMKAGAYTLGEAPNLSVLEAVSYAGGLARLASPQNARILRRKPGSEQRVEEAINMKKVLDGSSPTVVLHADDILFIPLNKPKAVAMRALDTAVNTGSSLIIFRR